MPTVRGHEIATYPAQICIEHLLPDSSYPQYPFALNSLLSGQAVPQTGKLPVVFVNGYETFLDQINCVVPSGLPSDDSAPLTATSGARTSNTVTIAVH
jgi:hypothetical protein